MPADAFTLAQTKALKSLFTNLTEASKDLPILKNLASKSDADQIWILLSGFLVFWMHAGFSMLEAGSVRHKNTINILFKNIVTVAIGAIAYFFVGYGFAYGENSAAPKFIGSGDYLLLSDNFGNDNAK